jgi:hypothetical protein
MTEVASHCFPTRLLLELALEHYRLDTGTSLDQNLTMWSEKSWTILYRGLDHHLPSDLARCSAGAVREECVLKTMLG